jgi:hypothetical protein
MREREGGGGGRERERGRKRGGDKMRAEGRDKGKTVLWGRAKGRSGKVKVRSGQGGTHKIIGQATPVVHWCFTREPAFCLFSVLGVFEMGFPSSSHRLLLAHALLHALSYIHHTRPYHASP